MNTNLSPQSAQFLVAIDQVETRIAQANRQVTTGKKISAPADAPDQISGLLQLRAVQQHNAQIQSNLTLAQTDANAADDALSSSTQLMDTALTLAAQGATDTSDANSRLSLAQQVQSIRQQLVANSQTAVQGRFIFSGDQDGSQQYTWNASAPNPVVAAANLAQSTRLIEDPAGGTFAASKTAQEIFDHQDTVNGGPANDNVFNALAGLQSALENNDTAGITNSITLLKASSEHLNTMQSFYGNVEDTVQAGQDYATKYDVQLQTQLSQTQDADITSAILEMTQANTQLQAAFQMQAQTPHNSLFSYLG